jgi:hypothetical protein
LKTLLKIIIIVALVVVFGSLPLAILGKVFEWLAAALKFIANAIDFFGWGGILQGG